MPVPLLKLCPPAESLVPDADLVTRFASERDEAAFAELVRRHGPVVYRVCRRLSPADADDAFQAVFLVLACRVASIRTPGAVGSWLVGVAGRVARQVRAARHRRAGHERAASRREAQDAPPDTSELAAVLDEELARLPDELRDPVVLCLIYDRTHAQAAADLGGSVRTLRRRLDRARAVLRARLESRGVIPAVAGALVAGIGEASGAAPTDLTRQAVAVALQFLDGTAPATPAVAAAKGVVASMTRFKTSALLVSAAAMLVCLGVGWAGDGPPDAPPAPVGKAQLGPAAPDQKTSIKFTGPAGMRITWQLPTGGFDDEAGGLTAPKEHSFVRGQVYRLRLTQVPNHRKSFYPTLEVAPGNPKTATFLAHASVPLAFTDEDFDQAVAGNLVVKAVYLPDGDNQDLAAGAEEVVSPRLEPGADPVAEARRRGTILCVVRLGNIDLESKESPAPTAPPVSDTTHRTANFVVSAPTAVMARALAAEAEYQRRAQALKWLGKELPAWQRPCVVRFTPGVGGSGGASTFAFDKDADGKRVLKTAAMEIRGDFLTALNNTLPHEVTHAVLATVAGRPLPRWADEGMAILSESAEDQADHDARLRELMGRGRAIRLKVLLGLAEYPRDVMVLYTQGHSVARFLAGRVGVPVLKNVPHLGQVFKPDGHRRLLAFVLIGCNGNTAASWNEAARAAYGFESVDALEEAWLEWLAGPESVLPRKGGTAPRPAVPEKAGGSDLIPPVKLPTAPAPFNRDVGERR
jgi:RNA polymerase sigma factor (sigma-70 family)